jgi:hypothetical protein
MKFHSVLCGLTAAVLLSACAGAQTGGPRASKTCPGNSCDVEVRVTMVGGAPRVEIDFDQLRFPRGNQDVTVVWKLKDSPQWTFKETSIAPHTGAPSGGKETTSANEWRSQIKFLSNSAVNYVVENANNRPAKLTYNITVFRKTDNTPVTLDPTLLNDGI